MVEHHKLASVSGCLYIMGVEDRYLVMDAAIFCVGLAFFGSTLITYGSTAAVYVVGYALYAWNPQWLSLLLLMRKSVNRHAHYDSRRRP